MQAKKGTNNYVNQEGQGRSKCARTTESKKQGRSEDNEDNFHCMMHGPNPTHKAKNCCKLKKHAEKLKKKKISKRLPQNSRKDEWGFKLCPKEADKRKRADRNKSTCEQEINKFSNMSLEQKAVMDMEDKEFWNFGPIKWQKGVFGPKKHSYKLLDQYINEFSLSATWQAIAKKQTSITAKLMKKNSPYCFHRTAKCKWAAKHMPI